MFYFHAKVLCLEFRYPGSIVNYFDPEILGDTFSVGKLFSSKNYPKLRSGNRIIDQKTNIWGLPPLTFYFYQVGHCTVSIASLSFPSMSQARSTV